MIKAIIFDAGGVIWKTPYVEIVKALAKVLDIDVEEMVALDNELKPDLLINKINVEQECEVIRERFNLSISGGQIFDIFSDVYKKTSKADQVLLDFAESLRDKYKVAMVSNVSNMSAEICKKDGYYNIFDPCILSYEVGVSKPAKPIFQLALDELKLKGEECVFIDDKEAHFPGAKELNILTLLFKDNETLKEELREIGVDC